VILERHPEIKQLSTAEKLALVAELWDDVAKHPENVPVSEECLAELDQRMAEYRRDPSKVTSWEAIKARILGSPANS
jgi:putative addiction module component (TIGR02574 family)